MEDIKANKEAFLKTSQDKITSSLDRITSPDKNDAINRSDYSKLIITQNTSFSNLVINKEARAELNDIKTEIPNENKKFHYRNSFNKFNEENKISGKHDYFNENLNNVNQLSSKSVNRISFINGIASDISDIEKLESPLFSLTSVLKSNYILNHRLSKIEIKNSNLSKNLLKI